MKEFTLASCVCQRLSFASSSGADCVTCIDPASCAAEVDFENPGLSVDYGISAVPSVIAFRRGELFHRLVGMQSTESMVNALVLTA